MGWPSLGRGRAGKEEATVRACVRAAGLQRDLHASCCWLVLVARVDSVHDFPCFRRKESGLGWCRVESLRQSGVESSYTVGRQAGRQAGGQVRHDEKDSRGSTRVLPKLGRCLWRSLTGHVLEESRREKKRVGDGKPAAREGRRHQTSWASGPGISPTDASRRVVVGISVSASPTKPESAKGKTGAGGGGRKAGACRS